MFIVHVTTVHPRFDVRIFHKECVALAAAGHAVTLLVADGRAAEERQRVSIRPMQARRSRVSRFFLGLPTAFRACVRLNADVYHLHDPELLLVAGLLKLLGSTVLFDAHEDVSKQILGKPYLPRWIRGVVSWVYSAFERFVVGRLDGVVAATPTIRDNFLSSGISSVDVNNFPRSEEFTPDERIPDAERHALCYVGGITRARGVREVVQAVALVQHPVTLLLAGRFHSGNFRSELEGLDGWSRVSDLGWQDRAGVRRVLDQSLVGLVTLHPSANYVESLPVKMFEYMASGVAVVASDFPLWREIIDRWGCGVCVDPLSPRAIADALERLLAYPEEARAMGQRGRIAVEERFNWEKEKKKLLSLYDGLPAKAVAR